METLVILDEVLQPNQVSKSIGFSNGQVLIFDSPNLPVDESIEFGFSLVGEFNLLNRNPEKLLPVTLLEKDFTLQANTELIFYIPREISETNIITFCYFHSAIAVNLRAYVIRSSVTQESLFNSLEELKTRELVSDTALIGNQVAQNTALITLGASLAPLTLGTSLAIEPILLSGNSLLTPLLLPP